MVYLIKNEGVLLKFAIVFLFLFFIVFPVLNSQNINEEIPLEGEEEISNSEIDKLNDESRDLTFVNPVKSIELAKIALQASENYERGTAYAYRNMANVFILNEVYSWGAQYLKDAEDIFTQTNDTVGLADCYISYGHLYSGLHDHEAEIKYFKKAFELYKPTSMSGRFGVAALNLAQSYYDNMDYSESKELVDLAIDLNKNTDQLQVLSACYNLVGEIELKKGNEKEALDYFNKVINLTSSLEENSQKIATIESLIHLSEIYESYSDKQSESVYLHKALSYALQNNLSNYIISIYNKLILHQLKYKETDAAKSCLIELNAKSDSITQNRMNVQSELVNKLIEAHELENKNKLLEINNQLQQKSLKIRNIFLILFSFLSFVILIFSIMLKRVYNKMRFQNIELKSQNNLIVAQKKELSEHVLNRERLISIIAHDLRNPFNSMLLSIELLFLELENNDVTAIRSRVLRLENITRSTYELLEKLLLWAKNQNENVQPEMIKLPLNEVVNESVEPLLGAAQLKNISISNKISNEIKVFANYNMLLTIFRNLVQNAVKFTSENGVIEIISEIKSDNIEVSVKDNGIGMDETVVKNIFTFEKSKIRNGTSGESGSGLGLILCKQFVEKMNGEIYAESVLGVGTKIVFTLPVS